MKEFNLTQPYASITDMVNSEEVKSFINELQQGNIDEYAIVSRIGNRYDIDGKKISKFAANPYVITCANIAQVDTENKEQGENDAMKYAEIETMIDNEVAKAVKEVEAKHAQELAELKERHAQELVTVKSTLKAELIAKLND